MSRHLCAKFLLTLALALATAGLASAQGHILIFSGDGAGEGFNDPTPAAPVPGNPGTTLGQQRVFVFLYGAAIWESVLQPVNDIYVIARFDPLAAGVLGSAGAGFVHRNFAGAELADTWYADALADQLSGTDLNPCCFDISARFSSNFAFYFGVDNNEPATQVDLLPVVLHELGHGLGFANFVDETSGTLLLGGRDVYSQYTVDVTNNLVWNDMTDAQRQASALNVRKVSWNGLHVNQDVPAVLSPGEPFLRVDSPAALGTLPIGPASFGPALTSPGLSGAVALATYGAGVTNGCSPITSDVAGKIALMDRGVCTFNVKVKNAQDAGAIAALIADNVQDSPPPGLGGIDPSVTIPSGRVALDHGNTIKANLAGGVQVTMGLDLSILAGTDRVQGKMMLAAFNPVKPGSSISHYEGIASRNQLMEPAINPDLTSSLEAPVDLTTALMTDIGWFSDQDGVPDGVDSCIGSDTSATVVVGGCDSGVGNTLFSNGCTISDLIGQIGAGAANHGQFTSQVAQFLNSLKKAGVITGSQKDALQSCAAGAAIP